MKKWKPKYVDAIPFNQHLTIVWNNEIEAYDKEFDSNLGQMYHNHWKDGDAQPWAACYSNYDEGVVNRWIVVLPSTKWCDTTVYHESLHAAFRILDFCGVHVTYENNEILAHMIGYFAEEIFKFYEEL